MKVGDHTTSYEKEPFASVSDTALTLKVGKDSFLQDNQK
jgi:hypothetical protein